MVNINHAAADAVSPSWFARPFPLVAGTPWSESSFSDIEILSPCFRPQREPIGTGRGGMVLRDCAGRGASIHYFRGSCRYRSAESAASRFLSPFTNSRSVVQFAYIVIRERDQLPFVRQASSRAGGSSRARRDSAGRHPENGDERAVHVFAKARQNSGSAAP